MYPVKHFFISPLKNYGSLEREIRKILKERERSRLSPGLRVYADAGPGDWCCERRKNAFVFWIVKGFSLAGIFYPNFIIDYGKIGRWMVVGVKVRFSPLAQILLMGFYAFVLHWLITGVVLPWDDDLVLMLIRILSGILFFAFLFYAPLHLIRSLKNQTLGQLKQKLTLTEIPWEKRSLLSVSWYVPSELTDKTSP